MSGGYDQYVRGRVPSPAAFAVVLLGDTAPSWELVVRRLESVGEVAVLDRTDDRLDVELAGREMRFELMPVPDDDEAPMVGDLDRHQRALLAEASTAMACATTYLSDPELPGVLGGGPNGDLHVHLRAMVAAAGDGVAIYDPDGGRCTSFGLAARQASRPVPPAPDAYVTIHAVTAGPAATAAWLHTHGLRRFGVLELDALDVPATLTDAIAVLLNATAARFVEEGTPPPETPIPVAERISLAWIPWEDAVSRFGPVDCGGLSDRSGPHAEPMASLGWLDGKGRLRPLREIGPRLKRGASVLITAAEGSRQAAVAQHELPRFVGLARRFLGQPGWAFSVKLGVPLGHEPADAPSGMREHLWFAVHRISSDGSRIDATLTQNPIDVTGLHAGQRRVWPATLVTGFSVDSPYGSSGPDGIDRVEMRVLEQELAS
jgi:hypothetical protein